MGPFDTVVSLPRLTAGHREESRRNASHRRGEEPHDPSVGLLVGTVVKNDAAAQPR